MDSKWAKSKMAESKAAQNPALPNGKVSRHRAATMTLSDAAVRLGMPISLVEQNLTILPLPGRKRVATAQLEELERWIAMHATARPWLGSILTVGKTIITGGERIDENNDERSS